MEKVVSVEVSLKQKPVEESKPRWTLHPIHLTATAVKHPLDSKQYVTCFKNHHNKLQTIANATPSKLLDTKTGVSSIHGGIEIALNNGESHIVIPTVIGQK